MHSLELKGSRFLRRSPTTKEKGERFKDSFMHLPVSFPMTFHSVWCIRTSCQNHWRLLMFRSLLLAVFVVSTAMQAVDENPSFKPLDPNMKIGPLVTNDAVRYAAAVFSSAEREIENDKTLTEEARANQLVAIQKLRKEILLGGAAVARYAPLVLAMNVCYGAEVGSTKLTIFKKIVPGLQGAGCLTFAASLDSGSLRPKVPTVGVSVLAGLQFAGVEYDEHGKPIRTLVQQQSPITYIVPFNHEVPITRIGDLQGFYVGGQVDWAIGGNSNVLKNVKSGSFSPYVLVDGLHLPRALMFTRVKTNTEQQEPFQFQGEVLYYGGWALDGSSFLVPDYLIPNWLMSGPRRFTKSPHAVENRLKEFDQPELRKVMERPEIRDALRPENAMKVLNEAQEALRAMPAVAEKE
jgi:hypothetical protein